MDEVPPFELFPGSRRAGSWVADRSRRVPVPAWPFIVLAALDFVVIVLAAGNRWSALGLLTALDLMAWALFPAAVIVGCPTAWRSARLVLLGAIGWSTIGAAAMVIWSLPVISSFGDLRLGVSLLREIAAIAAPIAIVMGLATRRRTSTTWPAIVVAIGVAGTALALVYVGSNAWGFYNDSPFDFGDVAAQKLELATQLLGPLILPGLGALAWSGLSALSAGEQPRRFWLALTGGSVAMLSAYVIGLALTWVLSSVGSGYPTDLSINIDQALTWVSVAAIGLFLLAFALGMPGDPFDLGDVTEDPGVPGEATA